MNISHFMSHEPVTGLTILNRVINLPVGILLKFTGIKLN